MYVRHLGLQDFRSWANIDLELTPGRTVFVGSNGYGKTNLVEALWYSSTLGSHRVATDAPLVRVGAQRAVVSTIVVNEGRECAVDLEIAAGRANKARLNRSPVRSPREVLGVLRAVLFAPEDLALVRGDPADRRRYLDDLAAVRRPRVAGIRADYDKVLRQRTALLKSASRQRGSGGPRRAGDPRCVGWSPGHTRGGVDGCVDEAGQRTALEVQKSYQLLAPELRTGVLSDISPVSTSNRSTRTSTYFERRCWPRWPRGAPPNSSVACAWSVHTATTWSCDSASNPRKALQATANRGRWRWRCGSRPTNCCADGSDPVLLLDDVFAELDTARREALAAAAASAEQVLVTAAVRRHPAGLGCHTCPYHPQRRQTGRCAASGCTWTEARSSAACTG